MLLKKQLMGFATLFVVFFFIHERLRALELKSPAGNYSFFMELKDGEVHYRVNYENKPLILPSRLGLEMQNGAVLGSNVSQLKISNLTEHDSTWKPLYGERSTVRDHYHSQVFHLSSENGLATSIEVRCYDTGVAFCYHISPQDGQQKQLIRKELTEFTFTGNHTTWVTETAQGEYQKTTIGGMKETYDRPQIFLDEDSQIYIAVGEARLVDYARMKLSATEEKANTVVAALSSDVTFAGKLSTPWRFIMAADQPGILLESNDLLLNLSDPCAIADTSWIKPGKILREVTLSDQGAYACIDYAAANGFKYMLFDAGWYGHEYDDSSDATTVTVDRKRSDGNIDMPKVVQYAKERGVGIVVYVNRRALEKQLDKILPLYQKWGIAGVKYGFVQVGSQKWTTWLHEAVRKAADHRLMINIHDEYRPTGYSRTYPNLMTQEGIGGDETSPSAKKSLGILFPRLLAGAADQTICYYSDRVTENGNHAFQMGKTVCFYSPWQVIFWYDRPANSPRELGGAGGGHRIIGEEPELEFFAQVPTVWDDTKVLEGRIEEYAILARRSGDAWYLGAMNADEPRKFEVKLSFLTSARKYKLRSYTHDESVATATKVKIEDRTVDADSVLKIDLQANDGAAYRIVPIDNEPSAL